MAWIRACGGGSPAIPDGKTVTPINDVTIWQKCAGIANPTYTTVNQILADSGTLSQLINSNNAVDYMVRSTSWASTICANQTAMQTIGANNYCSDTLIDNSTWRSAICNSTYFERVLNVKVPNMTGATSPSGQVSASASVTGYEPYRAFNSTLQWGWQPDAYGGVPSWIQYKFPSNVKVCKITAKGNAGGGNQYYNLQSSSNGSNFTTRISSFTLNTSGEHTVSANVSSTDDVQYWRVNYTGKDSTYNGWLQLQFYGRKDV